MLSEHSRSDVPGESNRETVFARDRFQAQRLVQIGIDLRELGAQHDLQQQGDFQPRQTATGFEVRDRFANAQADQSRQLLLAVAPRGAESIQIISYGHVS